MNEELLLRACGYVNNDGNRTRSEFILHFGFDPAELPHFFRIIPHTDIVTVTDLFRMRTRQHYACIQAHNNRLFERFT